MPHEVRIWGPGGSQENPVLVLAIPDNIEDSQRLALERQAQKLVQNLLTLSGIENPGATVLTSTYSRPQTIGFMPTTLNPAS